MFFSGQDIGQKNSSNSSITKKVNKNLVSKNSTEADKARLMDSLTKENEALVKEANHYIDVINKNSGYIKNNEKKIEKKESKVSYTLVAKKKKPLVKKLEVIDVTEPPELTIVYIPIKTCVKRKSFLNRFFANDDCNSWEITDSIKIEIQNY